MVCVVQCMLDLALVFRLFLEFGFFLSFAVRLSFLLVLKALFIIIYIKITNKKMNVCFSHTKKCTVNKPL